MSYMPWKIGQQANKTPEKKKELFVLNIPFVQWVCDSEVLPPFPPRGVAAFVSWSPEVPSPVSHNEACRLSPHLEWKGEGERVGERKRFTYNIQWGAETWNWQSNFDLALFKKLVKFKDIQLMLCTFYFNLQILMMTMTSKQ